MRVLIFSMTCGEGHNSIAKAIKQEFEDQLGNKVVCDIVQTYGFDEERVKKENDRLLKVIKYIPRLYQMTWNILRKRNPKKPSRVFNNEIKGCDKYFIEQIKAFKPDMIICTHVYASGVINQLIERGELDKGIITSTVGFDFCLSPFWECSTKLDYVFSVDEKMDKDLLAKNWNKNQIYACGIPIRKDFRTVVANNRNGEDFTALVIAGGTGIGNTLKVVESIVKNSPDTNVIVVNGRNQKTFNQIEELIKERSLTNITNLGFVNNLPDYFKKSDVVICRCGGCGVSEILCFGVPMIIREKLINNEKINKKFFIENGCALGMKRLSDAGKLVEKLKKNPQLCKEMGQNCANFAKPNAAKDLVDFLVKKYEERKEQ